jgi:hypothetical protein
MRLKLFLAGILLFTASTAFPQVAPTATQGGVPLSVGFGYSNFYTDWSKRESGETLWIDWNRLPLPARLNGLGLEIEARDLDWDRTGDNPRLRETTAGGGVIYHWRHFTRVDGYAKFIASLGHIEFTNRPGDYYTHDSRVVSAPGGGAAYRFWGPLWVRGEYEYQIWPDFLHHHAFNPDGFTVGMNYDLGRRRSY